MKPCAEIDRYCDRELGAEESAVFEAHLEGCASCRESVSRWKTIETAIASIEKSAEESMPAVTESDIRMLIEIAGSRQRPARDIRHNRGSEATLVLRLLRPAYAVIAALLFAGLAVFVWKYLTAERTQGDLEISAVLLQENDPMPSAMRVFPGRMLEAPPNGRVLVRIGGDRIGLGPEGRVGIAEATMRTTRLVLERGTVVCRVAHRAGAAEFVVEAGRYTVRVVGTYFSVTRIPEDGLDVRVFDGVVEVRAEAKRTWRVSKGQMLTIESFEKVGEAVPVAMNGTERQRFDDFLDESVSTRPRPVVPPTPPAPEPETVTVEIGKQPTESHAAPQALRDSIETWREWVIDGRLDEAGQALASYLRQRPRDKDAWSLLADCLRKQGDVEGAVLAYRKVIALAPADEANQARFRAGALLQDKRGSQETAIEFLDGYLRSSTRDRTLEAEALFRLGRAHRALGHDDIARKLLSEVVERHRGSAAAIQAGRLLNDMSKTEERKTTMGGEK